MARTKQCARKTGGKAPQPGGAKAKGRYFDAGGEGDVTSRSKKGRKSSNNVTSISNNQATIDVYERPKDIESPPLGWVEDRTGAPPHCVASHSSSNTTSAAPKSKTKTNTREPAKNRKSGKALAIRKSAWRNKQAKRKAARLEKEKRMAEKREKGMVEKKKKKEGRKDKRRESAAGGVDGQGNVVETQDGGAGREGESSASSEEEEDDEEEDGATQEVHQAGDTGQSSAQTQPTSRLLATPTQALNLEVDGILNVVEPVMRDIFRTQALAQCCNTSFAAASPSSAFIPEQLALMRSIVEMYEARGEGNLTRYQAYALESARLAVGELEYMRRSDEEEEGAASATRA